MRIEEIIKEVKDILSEKRFYHSECVMKRAEELAEIYGADIEKAKICGILHDLAKEMKKTDLLEYALKNNTRKQRIQTYQRKNDANFTVTDMINALSDLWQELKY